MKTIIVVGGGAAGMMAAYHAAQNDNQVILIEKNEKLGKKVFITGKGRCNVTNACDTEDFFRNVISNPKFLYSSIYGFDSAQVMEFFEAGKCPLKIERGERVFPVSDHSSDIIKCLENSLKKKNVTVHKNCEVKEILTDNQRITGVVTKEKERILADAVILATGGKSYVSTGSDGEGFKIAERLGHSVKELRPGLIPFVVKEEECKMMQGLSLKNVSLQLFCGKKRLFEGFGELLFTHFGMSGPLVLSASSYRNKNHFSDECKAVIDLKPALSFEMLDKRILRDFEEAGKKQFKNILPGLVPSKMAGVLPAMCDIAEDKTVNEITKEERLRLVTILKGMEFTVTGCRDLNEAIITMGGISVKEINPSTMESKLVKGLYFAGEMIDVDALTGGFNLQIAWSTGCLAGLHAGEKCE